MPNPWPQRSPKTFGQIPVNAGVRRDVTDPFSTVDYWYDATDQSTVWADQAGTIPISNGVRALRWDSKGLIPLSLTSGAANTAIWQLNQIGGLPALTVSGGGTLAALAAIGSGPNGASHFAVGRAPALFPAPQGLLGGSWQQSPGADSFAQIITVTGLIRTLHHFTGFVTLKASGVGTEWYWLYQTISTAGNYKLRVSGEPVVTGNATYDPILDGAGTLRDSGTNSDDAEIMRWNNRVLTDAELQQLIDYAETKYGGVFPIP